MSGSTYRLSFIFIGLQGGFIEELCGEASKRRWWWRRRGRWGRCTPSQGRGLGREVKCRWPKNIASNIFVIYIWYLIPCLNISICSGYQPLFDDQYLLFLLRWERGGGGEGGGKGGRHPSWVEIGKTKLASVFRPINFCPFWVHVQNLITLSSRRG